MDYKEANKKIYDENALVFWDKTKDFLTEHISEDAELFMSNLRGKRILDLGSGPGRDSLFFRDKGFKPVCIDISPQMIKLCRDKGLEAYEMDLENLDFEKESFDGIWAYTSLLHIPKSKMGCVLANIGELLKDKGMFYLGMKEGNFEGWLESEKYKGGMRFFSLYSHKELQELISELFDILHSSRIKLGNAVFLNYLCRKKLS